MALSTEEKHQIQQTIEMFEKVAEANPDDYQALALLKEAYQKLGRMDQALETGRRLGEAYARSGQNAAAIREFEHVLQHHPDNEELSGKLDALIRQLHDAGRQRPKTSAPTDAEAQALAAFETSLMATEQTRMAGSGPRKVAIGEDDGNDQFARFLINNNIAPADRVRSALEAVRVVNGISDSSTIGTSLIDEVCRNRPPEELENLVATLLDRTRFAYIPLDYYEVDRSIVKLLPDELALRRLIVPFDQMGQTMLVALCNPFDAAGKEAVQQMLAYDIRWYFALPSAITRVLADAYRLAGID